MNPRIRRKVESEGTIERPPPGSARLHLLPRSHKKCGSHTSRRERPYDVFASPQTPNGKHFDTRKESAGRDAVPRMECFRGEQGMRQVNCREWSVFGERGKALCPAKEIQRVGAEPAPRHDSLISQKSLQSIWRDFPDCQKTRESSRGPQPFRTFNRAQRRVRWARGDFCAGKSHFPEKKSFPCSLRARKIFDF